MEKIVHSHVAIFFFINIIIAGVVSDDDAPIPADKRQISKWFNANVAPLSARKGTLDLALEAAEEEPQVIKVRQDGSASFTTITEAIDSIQEGNKRRLIVDVGPGRYKEKVTIDQSKPFVTLHGAPDDRPTLVFDATAAKYGTVDSATLIVLSDYFMAVNFIIENSAPEPDGKMKGAQAVAMRISGDKAAFYNCDIIGYQDTVCDDKGNHFFKDCLVQGTVDFIFGSGNSLYLSTELRVVGEGMRVIAAQARKSKEERDGFVFVHCNVTGTGGSGAYLGRTWMPYAKVIYAYTAMSDVVGSPGWSNNFRPEHEKTAFFGEYQCSGPGASRSGRAGAKSFDAPAAQRFLVLGYIEGSKWLLPPPASTIS